MEKVQHDTIASRGGDHKLKISNYVSTNGKRRQNKPTLSQINEVKNNEDRASKKE